MISIDSNIQGYHGKRMIDRTDVEIKNEPMLFNCSLEGARRLGGSITQEFLYGLPEEWLHLPLAIDTRVHMLMPGWYPCIPGWHHDDVPRTRADGQPNYGPGQDRSTHIMALVNGDICPTYLALGTGLFSEIPFGQICYKRWHEEVEYHLRTSPTSFNHKDNCLTSMRIMTNYRLIFNDRTWHRGSAAVDTGWRWFGRVSRYWDCNGKIIARRNIRTNEVRKQVQVYLGDVNGGW